jgi:integrase/recombinase XerD
MAAARTPADHRNPRSLTLAEFGDYLRTINNRDGRPYEDTTINAYVFPATALGAWMTANSLDGDFTTVDTAMLNRYFREYHQTRAQGGTHTVRGRPKTLSPTFIDDLLEVTGGAVRHYRVPRRA